jgi:hypothetical protein
VQSRTLIHALTHSRTRTHLLLHFFFFFNLLLHAPINQKKNKKNKKKTQADLLRMEQSAPENSFCFRVGVVNAQVGGWDWGILVMSVM